jgi:hypothetical protein
VHRRDGDTGSVQQDATQDVVPTHIQANGIFHRLAHKLYRNAALSSDQQRSIHPSIHPSKPDIPPDQRWRIPMKNLILAAFAALSLSVAIAPRANAATFNST